MARVKMFKITQGDVKLPVEEAIALTKTVQKKLDLEAFKGRVKATSALSVVKARQAPSEMVSIDEFLSFVRNPKNAAEGHSNIEPVHRGRIDRYVILSDDRGDKAAAAIEFGRDAYYLSYDGSGGGQVYKVGSTTGAYVLHKAFGLAPGQLKARANDNTDLDTATLSREKLR